MSPACRGFSLVEAAIASVILGVLVVGGLETLGAAARARRNMSDRAIARACAELLASEIQGKAYEDPEDGAGSLGVNSGEAGADRSRFDDADDYTSYSQIDPAIANGTSLGLGKNWTWSVKVERVAIDASGGLAASGVETGSKRVTITIQRNARPIHVMTLVRSRGWDRGMP